MDFKKLAQDILRCVGTQENVISVMHCATRLRFQLKDMNKVNVEVLKKVKGVMGVQEKSGQLQVIIGPDVSSVCREILKLGSFSSNESNEKKSKKLSISSLIEVIAGIFTPIIPAITGAGMLKALLVILTTFKIISSESQTYYFLSFISDAAFYFLPVMLAYTSAEKFACNKFLAVTIAGVLLHPNLSALGQSEEAVKFLGMNVVIANYASSVIPIILAVWVQSYIEKIADKISPKPIKVFTRPLLTILVVAPIALIVLGPIGTYFGDIVASGLNTLNEKAAWLPPLLMGAFSPLIIMTGMHYSLMPVAFAQLTSVGYVTIDLPGMLAANVAQGGAALCVALKSKNKNLKQLAGSTGLTAVLGITEPAMYGVNLKLKRPFYAVMIGGACGGLYAGLNSVRAYAMAAPGLAALPIFIGGNGMGSFINAIITCVVAFVVSFVATWILGFEDEMKDENNEIIPKEIHLKAPIVGQVVQLSQVDDETFSSEMLGKGMAIIPSEGKVVSPVEGEISIIFPSKHAIAIKSNEGAEILIHVGLETVNLNGKYFKTFVKTGDKVKVGDKLMEFDIEGIKSEGYNLITPVVVTNSNLYNEIEYTKEETIKHSSSLLTLGYN